MKLVAIDFETANRYRESPCAIGLVVVDETGIVDEFYSLINPLMDFDSFNIYIHGITENDVENAPTFAELWPTVNEYLSDSLVVAHNASFDMSVLRATLDRYNLTFPKLEYLCSVMISKHVWPGLQNYKLNTLANFKGIKLEHHHALEDARTAALLMLEAVKDKQTKDVRTLTNMLQISCGKIYERSYIAPKVKKRTTRTRVSRVTNDRWEMN